VSPVSVGRVLVPGPRKPGGYDPRFQEHVLVIRALGDGLEPATEWEVEHPEDCPLKCFWWPGANDYLLELDSRPEPERTGARGLVAAGEHDCYVSYELDNIGLDTLGLSLVDDQDESAIVNPAHASASEFEAFWHSLLPGRYAVEGWYEPSRSMGPYGDSDPDGGLILTRRLP
jgi:hypothetical protein